MKIRDITLIAAMSVLLYVSQIALGFLPNIEIVSFLVIFFTLHFKKRVIWIIGIFILLEGITYGINTWFFMYLYIWYLLAGATALLRKQESMLLMAVVSGTFGFLFGTLCSPVYLAIGGLSGMTAFIISGIPFDIVHGISNVAVMLVLYKPMCYLFRVYKKTPQAESTLE